MQISLNLGTLLATADVSTGRLIGTLLVAIALILFLILKWRVQAFIALLVASVFVGVAAGTMSMTEVGGTIVVLMGVSERAEIASRLMSGGLAADTPVAAIRYGTRPEQTTIRTTLGELADAPLESPSTIVIGQVAAFDFSPTAVTSAWARKAGHASLD